MAEFDPTEPGFEKLSVLNLERLSLREMDIFEKTSGIPIDKISSGSPKALITVAHIVVGMRRRGVTVTADQILDYPDVSDMIDTSKVEAPPDPKGNPTEANV